MNRRNFLKIFVGGVAGVGASLVPVTLPIEQKPPQPSAAERIGRDVVKGWDAGINSGVDSIVIGENGVVYIGGQFINVDSANAHTHSIGTLESSLGGGHSHGINLPYPRFEIES